MKTARECLQCGHPQDVHQFNEAMASTAENSPCHVQGCECHTFMDSMSLVEGWVRAVVEDIKAPKGSGWTSVDQLEFDAEFWAWIRVTEGAC